MTTAVEAQTLRFRATFEADQYLTLATASQHIHDLESLIYTTTAITTFGPELGAQLEIDGYDSLTRAADAFERTWLDFTPTIRVHSISYNSPLEIIYTVAAGASFGTTMFFLGTSQALTLFSKYQAVQLQHHEIRIKRAEADRTEFETNKFIAEQIGLESLANLQGPAGRPARGAQSKKPRKGFRKHHVRRFYDTGRALRNLRDLRFTDE